MTMSRVRIFSFFFNARIYVVFIATAFCAASICSAQTNPAAPSKPAQDVLLLSDGDTLHGKLVSEVAGKVTFHTESLGDVVLTWDKIKELHTAQKFAVLDNTVKLRGKNTGNQIPVGALDVAAQTLAVHPDAGAAPAPIPVKNAQYVVDNASLEKQLNHQPGFFTGWNGAGTAGATLVSATQNQSTFSGGVSLVRVVPTVSWLNSRNRTSTDFSGSFGKITQPAYAIPATSTSPAMPVAATVTKTSISHFDAERDQYFSPRFFALAQMALDHNFGQDLSLQQAYGGGIGWTAIKSPKQELDLKGSMQYEKQQFIQGSGGASENLVGSTFSATYALHFKLVNYIQAVAYIPAYNDFAAYSTAETDTFAFPAYKSLSFSVGTLDSYLNDPPSSEPPTKRNSFQFTMGFTYAIQSKY